MVRNRNGYWMYKLFSPDSDGTSGAGGGVGGGTAAPEGTPAGADQNGDGAGGESTPAGEQKQESESMESLKARIAQLEAKAVKDKQALDKATHEASEANKALKAKMTQEEMDAAAKKEAEEQREQEIAEMQKELARNRASKSIMGRIGLAEEEANKLADALYGAADLENALLIFQKAWQGREKALKMEYGKIPGPGTGGDSNSPEAQAIERAKQFAQRNNAVSEQAKKAMDAYLR